MTRSPSNVLADLRADYVARVNTVLESGREDLAHELAESYAAEQEAVRRQADARAKRFDPLP